MEQRSRVSWDGDPAKNLRLRTFWDLPKHEEKHNNQTKTPDQKPLKEVLSQILLGEVHPDGSDKQKEKVEIKASRIGMKKLKRRIKRRQEANRKLKLENTIKSERMSRKRGGGNNKFTSNKTGGYSRGKGDGSRPPPGEGRGRWGFSKDGGGSRSPSSSPERRNYGDRGSFRSKYNTGFKGRNKSSGYQRMDRKPPNSSRPTPGKKLFKRENATSKKMKRFEELKKEYGEEGAFDIIAKEQLDKKMASYRGDDQAGKKKDNEPAQKGKGQKAKGGKKKGPKDQLGVKEVDRLLKELKDSDDKEDDYRSDYLSENALAERYPKQEDVEEWLKEQGELDDDPMEKIKYKEMLKKENSKKIKKLDKKSKETEQIVDPKDGNSKYLEDSEYWIDDPEEEGSEEKVDQSTIDKMVEENLKRVKDKEFLKNRPKFTFQKKKKPKKKQDSEAEEEIGSAPEKEGYWINDDEEIGSEIKYSEEDSDAKFNQKRADDMHNKDEDRKRSLREQQIDDLASLDEETRTRKLNEKFDKIYEDYKKALTAEELEQLEQLGQEGIKADGIKEIDIEDDIEDFNTEEEDLLEKEQYTKISKDTDLSEVPELSSSKTFEDTVQKNEDAKGQGDTDTEKSKSPQDTESKEIKKPGTTQSDKRDDAKIDSLKLKHETPSMKETIEEPLVEIKDETRKEEGISIETLDKDKAMTNRDSQESVDYESKDKVDTYTKDITSPQIAEIEIKETDQSNAGFKQDEAEKERLSNMYKEAKKKWDYPEGFPEPDDPSDWDPDNEDDDPQLPAGYETSFPEEDESTKTVKPIAEEGPDYRYDENNVTKEDIDEMHKRSKYIQKANIEIRNSTYEKYKGVLDEPEEFPPLSDELADDEIMDQSKTKIDTENKVTDEPADEDTNNVDSTVSGVKPTSEYKEEESQQFEKMKPDERKKKEDIEEEEKYKDLHKRFGPDLGCMMRWNPEKLKKYGLSKEKMDYYWLLFKEMMADDERSYGGMVFKETEPGLCERERIDVIGCKEVHQNPKNSKDDPDFKVYNLPPEQEEQYQKEWKEVRKYWDGYLKKHHKEPQEKVLKSLNELEGEVDTGELTPIDVDTCFSTMSLFDKPEDFDLQKYKESLTKEEFDEIENGIDIDPVSTEVEKVKESVNERTGTNETSNIARKSIPLDTHPNAKEYGTENKSTVSPKNVTYRKDPIIPRYVMDEEKGKVLWGQFVNLMKDRHATKIKEFLSKQPTKSDDNQEETAKAYDHYMKFLNGSQNKATYEGSRMEPDLNYEDRPYTAWPKLRSFMEGIKRGEIVPPPKHEASTETKTDGGFTEAWTNVPVPSAPPPQYRRDGGLSFQGAIPFNLQHNPNMPSSDPRRGTHPEGISASSLHGIGPPQSFYPAPPYGNVRPTSMMQTSWHRTPMGYTPGPNPIQPSTNDPHGYGYYPNPTPGMHNYPVNPYSGYGDAGGGMPPGNPYYGQGQGLGQEMGYGRMGSRMYYGPPQTQAFGFEGFSNQGAAPANSSPFHTGYFPKGSPGANYYNIGGGSGGGGNGFNGGQYPPSEPFDPSRLSTYGQEPPLNPLDQPKQ